MRRTAITGISGYLGSQLLAALEGTPDVEKVVGIDLRQPQQASRKLVFVQRDVTAPLADLLKGEGVETLVHLAFLLKPLRDRRRSKEINVGGTANVLAACVEAGVRHILFMGSSTAYGAHPDNPVPLPEEAPLRPNRGMPYAEDKAETDLMLQAFAKENPEVKVCILRACPVLGPHADNFVVKALFRSLVYKVAGYDPPMQFVHEDDLLRLLVLCQQEQVAGIYNVAGRESIRYSMLAKLAGKPMVALPPDMLEFLASLSWHLRLQSDGTRAGVAFIKYPWVARTEKLERELGFSFQFTTQEALLSFIRGRLKRPGV